MWLLSEQQCRGGLIYPENLSFNYSFFGYSKDFPYQITKKIQNCHTFQRPEKPTISLSDILATLPAVIVVINKKQVVDSKEKR